MPEPDADADAEPAGGGWAAAFITGEAHVELTPLRLEKRRLAVAMRRTIEAMVSVDAPIDEVRAAADELEALAVRFEAAPESSYVGFAEAANSPHSDGFFDHSPILGQANPLAPPLHLEFGHDIIVATATFGSAYEGPPGCVHGGWIAAAFDEVLGATQSLSGSGGMTAYLKVDYRSPTPLHQPLRFEGELVRTEGRKIFTTGRLLHGDVLTAEAEALFISIDFARFAEMRARRERTGS
ncbi:MAG: PaaI family thioesterase [Acidimicrobiia bacterium]|nr:PaaI family thioesterase [Acidimicrobiia bacterium]